MTWGTASEMATAITSIRVLNHGNEPVTRDLQEDMPVTGITTLETLGFQIDPVSRRLQPRDYFFL